MKRWVLPILCALAFHWVLYRFDFISMPPVMAMPENRTVTISLVQMRPKPAPRPHVQPLEVKAPDSIAPLSKLTPKPTPKPEPEPIAVPDPVREETSPVPPPPEPTTPEEASPEPAAPEAPQESMPPPDVDQAYGPDQAEVQASTPLYHLNPPPAYPAMARRRNYQGIVLLDVLVNRQGRVDKAEIAQSSGYRVLDRSAVKSVRQWRFEPARRFGRPIEMWVQVPIKFELR